MIQVNPAGRFLSLSGFLLPRILLSKDLVVVFTNRYQITIRVVLGTESTSFSNVMYLGRCGFAPDSVDGDAASIAIPL